ncbi:helix-turn-helix transcriptional regulator [Chloroflexota bacterium]
MVSNRIREVREKAGLSQAALARRLRIAGPNLSAVERGRLEPWPKLRRDLARILKMSQKQLFPENGHHGTISG